MYQLHSFQIEALKALESPNHVICVAPTGAGKSLIYEKIASRPGVRTLLVTPLVALARQQAKKLEHLGIRVSLGAGNPLSQNPDAIPGPRTGVWIVSPELLQVPARSRILNKWKPNFLVVDECHCLWEWGEDFRPAFYPLPELIKHYSIPKSLWLTATLPEKARVDLKRNIPAPVVEIGRFQLPAQQTLNVLKVPLEFRGEVLKQFVNSQNEPGLIFVSTRRDTQKMGALLNETQKRVVVYHAGMSCEERRNLENKISEQNCDVVVATSAFGLGIHYSYLRWVVLWQPTLTLLGLAQSIGRVGRSFDKDPKSGNSLAIVFWDDEDFKSLEWSIRNTPRMRHELAETYRFLEKRKCRRILLYEYFEQTTSNGEGPSACEHYCDFCRARQSTYSN